MISKILKVKNLGRLNIPIADSDSHENKNDDFSFKKNTLIFGDNTCGKTTLASIFKSLKLNTSLEARKKFRSQEAIQIKVEYSEGDVSKFHEYGKETWQNNNILIFDNDFIKDHIFSEDQIKGEHLKSLPKVLIGDGIKQDIDQINLIVKCDGGSCSDCEFCLNAKLNKCKSTFNTNYRLDQYLKINTAISDIDKKIKEKEEVLSIDAKLSDLKKKSQESYFYKLDLKVIESSFDKKINNVFESIIEKHLSEKTNNLDRARGFLGYGLRLKKDNICPFCSQDTTSVRDFMGNLSSYFDKEYVDFKNEIETHSKIFLSFDLEKELLSFGQLGFTAIEDLFDKQQIQRSIVNVRNKVDQKKDDLNFDCDFGNDADFRLLADVFSKSKVILAEIIDKKALTHPEKVKFNQDVTHLKLVKYRYSEEGTSFYDQYKDINTRLKNKNEDKRVTQENLKKKVDVFFEDNLRNINSFLKELKADFQISKLVPAVDNRDKNNYLKINEYLFEFVDIQGNSISVEIGKFKETFSDSDKRILGFAFFLSVLRNDVELENRIIILDDPFSSFDINRKEETIKLFNTIKNVDNKEPRQKIVFTHEKSFYCQLNNLISSNDKKLLKLNWSVANNGTMFELIDIKKFESDRYYGDINDINIAIATNSHLDEALLKARTCLEYLLKAKYINTLENYRDENGNPINFNLNSIGSFLKAIDQKCIVRDQLSELELHRFHHDSHTWKTDLSDIGKNDILKKFIDLIEQV